MKSSNSKKRNLTKNVSKKLLSYAALSSAFILNPGSAQAQCGVASAGVPLAIDIDNDGTADLTIFVANNDFNTSYNFSNFVSSNVLYGNFTVSITGQTYVGTNAYYYGCQNAQVPGQGSGGYNVAASISNAIVTGYGNATAALYYDLYYVNYIFINTSVNYALAYANGSNALIGLSNNQTYLGNNIYNLCQIFGYSASPSIYATNALVGYDRDAFYATYTVKNGKNFVYNIGPGNAVVASSIFPQSICYTNTFSVFSVSFPPANPNIYVPFQTTTIPGTYYLGFVSSNTVSTNNSFSNSYLAVKFKSSGETFNGWVELSYDSATNEVTCLNTGYNSCSIEDATAISTASNSCIDVGAPDPSQFCCIPDLVINNFFSANPEFKVSNTIISDADSDGNYWQPATSINMTAETSIELISGFSIESGAEFSATIDDCN